MNKQVFGIGSLYSAAAAFTSTAHTSATIVTTFPTTTVFDIGRVSECHSR